VTLSYAQTLDGRVATLDGGSRWISCPESLLFAHETRAAHDAILVGSGTVRNDDPSLTVRLVKGRSPLRVVLDSSLKVPPTANVLADVAAPGTVIATTDRAPEWRVAEVRATGARVLVVPRNGDGKVDVGSLLLELGAMGVGSIMVEGGAAVITTFLRERLVDRIAVCIAPKILGSGIEAVGDLGIRAMDDAFILSDVSTSARGVDMILTARVEYPAHAG
jgi:5-amino-6-(5-phosphoribosylamino)uracil reductase/diaminohydroxyphosphoribosylaminopyrimidine deaminase/5-amino-6-(5-phosphoribosylamino)uracil reductase